MPFAVNEADEPNARRSCDISVTDVLWEKVQRSARVPRNRGQREEVAGKLSGGGGPTGFLQLAPVSHSAGPVVA